MKTITILTIIAGLALAGCIAPEAANESKAALAPPASDRVDGMTVTETKVDKDVDCGGGADTIPLPRTCAQRDLLAVGQIGVDELSVDLSSVNGPVTIKASEGDAWSFHAVVKVQSAPNQDAKAAIDQAWGWTHEADGKHAVWAGPKSSSPTPIVGLEPTLMSAVYELTLPEWVLLDVKAATSNGPITIAGTVRELSLTTSNGPITLVATPGATGAWTIETTNGPIVVVVPVTTQYGYDVDAKTSNGPIRIDLGEDGKHTTEKGHATFQSKGFDARPVQTTMTILTSNGPVTVEG